MIKLMFQGNEVDWNGKVYQKRYHTITPLRDMDVCGHIYINNEQVYLTNEHLYEELEQELIKIFREKISNSKEKTGAKLKEEILTEVEKGSWKRRTCTYQMQVGDTLVDVPKLIGLDFDSILFKLDNKIAQ